jgi:hypothetical protein
MVCNKKQIFINNKLMKKVNSISFQNIYRYENFRTDSIIFNANPFL